MKYIEVERSPYYVIMQENENTLRRRKFKMYGVQEVVSMPVACENSIL